MLSSSDVQTVVPDLLSQSCIVLVVEWLEHISWWSWVIFHRRLSAVVFLELLVRTLRVLCSSTVLRRVELLSVLFILSLLLILVVLLPDQFVSPRGPNVFP